MSTEIFLLYLWTRLDVIQGMLVAALVATSIVLVVSLLVWLFNLEADKEFSRGGMWIARRFLPWFVCIVVLVVIVPSRKDAAIIAGGWLVKEAATSEIAKTIGERTYKLIVGKLDEELSKLEGSKK